MNSKSYQRMKSGINLKLESLTLKQMKLKVLISFCLMIFIFSNYLKIEYFFWQAIHFLEKFNVFLGAHLILSFISPFQQLSECKICFVFSLNHKPSFQICQQHLCQHHYQQVISQYPHTLNEMPSSMGSILTYQLYSNLLRFQSAISLNHLNLPNKQWKLLFTQPNVNFLTLFTEFTFAPCLIRSLQILECPFLTLKASEV